MISAGSPRLIYVLDVSCLDLVTTDYLNPNRTGGEGGGGADAAPPHENWNLQTFCICYLCIFWDKFQIYVSTDVAMATVQSKEVKITFLKNVLSIFTSEMESAGHN